MRILSGSAALAAVKRLSTRSVRLNSLEPKVCGIVNRVRRCGDQALRQYAERWDGLSRKQALRVPPSEINRAKKSASPQLRRAIEEAAQNIRRFCEWQKPSAWTKTRGGTSLGQLVIPLDSVGCYVPGGRYPLVSTLLMTVIPAQCAGVTQIRVASPKPSDAVLAACSVLRVDELYRVGGAQAIAAFAYGTESIRSVDKIVGPGNAYVTLAKKLVSFDCAIDFLAGPTEAVVMSDSGNPLFIASDLVSQAEHDPDAVSLFITSSSRMAQAVAVELSRLSKRNVIARESLRRNGAILVAGTRQQAREWANLIAPEHITVSAEDVPHIRNAGSVFVGDYSPQAAGDYASGPNHVLPTSGQARFRGGLSVMDFVKLVTVQDLSRRALQQLSGTIEYLADLEGLRAHAESIRVRYQNA
jgi:histidinol dehydrogenase